MKISLIGSGGHARAVINLLSNNQISLNQIYDNSYHPEKEELIANYLLGGKIKDIPKNDKIVIALGDNTKREFYFKEYFNQIYKKSIIHSSALIEQDCKIGDANLFFAKILVNCNSQIGNNNILNTACVIEHECRIGNNNHISVGAILCGRVQLGNNCFVGAGSIIKDNISIVDNVTLGAGTVVVKNITEKGTYIGVPAKKIK